MRFQKYSPLVFCVFLALALSNALGAQDDFLSEEDLFDLETDASSSVCDPLEGINRFIFQFNDRVYSYLLNPLAQGYRRIMPEPVKKGVGHFFHNLRYPIRLSGNLLQGRWKGAWIETKRFVVNSTIGVAGIFPLADNVMNMAVVPSEDIGQALGSWGIGEGPYLVIPILGPSNLRDLMGLVGDNAVNPTSDPFSVLHNTDQSFQSVWIGARSLAGIPTLMDEYFRLKSRSIDPYSSLRQGHRELRRAAIAE